VKLLETLCGTPFTAGGTVPLNLELLVIGDVVGDVLELLSQAAAVRMVTSVTGTKNFMKYRCDTGLSPRAATTRP
jgi:hypothetical protein